MMILEHSFLTFSGAVVIMAMDQEGMDELVRNTRDIGNVDDFMGRMLRDDGDRQPPIRSNVTRRCDLTVTRPGTKPGVRDSC